MTTSRTTSPRWATMVAELRARRATRSVRIALEREIAAFSTPSDRSDMNSILDRYDPVEVAALRELLNRRPAAA